MISHKCSFKLNPYHQNLTFRDSISVCSSNPQITSHFVVFVPAYIVKSINNKLTLLKGFLITMLPYPAAALQLHSNEGQNMEARRKVIKMLYERDPQKLVPQDYSRTELY